MQEVERFVRLVDAANNIGVHVNTICRKLEANNIAILRAGPQSNADRIIASEDYDRLLNIVEQARERVVSYKTPDSVQTGSKGVYAFTYASNKFLKIGWSDDLTKRIADHRGLAVDMDNVKTWLTPFSHDENNIRDIAKGMGLNQVGPEVFQLSELSQIAEFCERVERLFALLGR